MATSENDLDLAFEFYETPAIFTRWLLTELAAREYGVCGTVIEPCAGNGAIVDAIKTSRDVTGAVSIFTNDLDTRRAAGSHVPAEVESTWRSWRYFDWAITNPPFGLALPIAAQALKHAGNVAIHVRGTIHEPLKTPGLGRSFLREHPPNLCLWLPRFAYRRSRTTGKWATDSATCCWLVWLRARSTQETLYAPDWVIDEAQEVQRARGR